MNSVGMTVPNDNYGIMVIVSSDHELNAANPSHLEQFT